MSVLIDDSKLQVLHGTAEGIAQHDKLNHGNTIGHSISNATESIERPAEVAEVTTLLGNETRFCGRKAAELDSFFLIVLACGIALALRPRMSCD